METYRVVWLSVCVPLSVAGAAVAVVLSPVAMAFLFLVFGAVGSLVAFCLVGAYWECGTVGRLRLLAGGWLAAGIGVGAFVGYASVLGPGVLLLAAAVSAGSPCAVNASRRWFRSVRTPSTAQPDAVARARASAYASPESAQIPAPQLRDLTDQPLRKRWRPSYRMSQRPPSTAQPDAVARARASAYASAESAQIPAPQLRDLTDQPLRKRWRPSYRMSQRPPSSAVKPIAADATRPRYLEELERRNSGRFRGLDGRGPHTAADPLPFLVGDRVVDWDELTRRQG